MRRREVAGGAEVDVGPVDVELQRERRGGSRGCADEDAMEAYLAGEPDDTVMFSIGATNNMALWDVRTVLSEEAARRRRI